MSDDFSNNEATNGSVEVGGTATGNIETARDRDRFAVDLVAGQTYLIDVEGEDTSGGTLGDTVIRGLYDHDNNRIANTRSRDGGTGDNARLEFTATETGTYYIEVRGRGEQTGTYTVQVTDVSEIADARDSAIDLGDITDLAKVKFRQDSLDGSSDQVDYYRFTLTEAKQVDLGLRRQDANADLFVEDEEGNTLSSATATGTTNERLLQTLLAGTYYVRVEAQEEGTNSYRFRYGVEEADPLAVAHLEDLPADSSTTGRVDVGGSVRGSITGGNTEAAADTDWYGVELVAGQVYVIDLMGVTLSEPKIAAVWESHDGALRIVVDTRDDDGGEGQNSRVVFAATTSGLHYIAVASDHDGDVGTYDLSISTLEEDIPATLQTTGSVAVGGTVTGTIDESRDMDAFRVTLVEGTTYEFALVGRSGYDGDTLPDPRIVGLLDPSDQMIPGTGDDDGGFGTNSRMRFVAQESGTYAVVVTGDRAPVEHGQYGETGTYTLSVDEVTVDDDFRDDPTTSGVLDLSSATPTRAVSVQGSIETPGDVDWFAVSLSEGESVILRVQGDPFDVNVNGLETPALIGVYDAETQLVSEPDDDIEHLFRAPSTGTYYVAVASGQQGGTGDYTVFAYPGPDSPDDFDASVATTGRVEVGSSVQGTIEWAHDVDWIAVDLAGGTRYQIDLEGVATDGGTLPYPSLNNVYDDDGNWRGRLYAHDTGEGTNDRGYFTPYESGTYYITVESFLVAIGHPDSQGTYTLSVDVAPEQQSVDEEDDDLAATTATTGRVVVGDTAGGTIDAGGDEDWFAVELVAGERYAFIVDGDRDADDIIWATEITGIYDSDGLKIANTSSDEQEGEGLRAIVTIEATETGTHYVGVVGSHSGQDGDYVVSVERVGDDDFSADTGTSGTLAVGGSATGEIEMTDDEDWFAVELVGGQLYRFEVEMDFDWADYPTEYPGEFILEGLYDANGNRVVAEGASFSFLATTDGIHYVAVRSDTGAGYDAIGTYEVSVEETQLDTL